MCRQDAEQDGESRSEIALRLASTVYSTMADAREKRFLLCRADVMLKEREWTVKTHRAN